MKGAMIIFLLAVFLLLIVAYLAQDEEAGERAGSKAYHMLLLGFMKLDIAWAHGMRYVHIALESICGRYHAGSKDMEQIHRKELRMKEYRSGSSEYVRRKQYNRKILQ